MLSSEKFPPSINAEAKLVSDSPGTAIVILTGIPYRKNRKN